MNGRKYGIHGGAVFQAVVLSSGEISFPGEEFLILQNAPLHLQVLFFGIGQLASPSATGTFPALCGRHLQRPRHDNRPDGDSSLLRRKVSP
jgi:hypothetical protein